SRIGEILAHGRVSVALAHILATVRACKVHAVAFGRCDEPADLFQTIGREPPFPAPTLHRETIRRLLVGTAELVAALVCMDPELHRGRHPAQQSWVENEEAGIGGAVIVELMVEHGRALAANDPAVIELELT